MESASRAQLAQRYKCEVIPDVSFEACQEVEDTLASSLAPEQLTELENRPPSKCDQAERAIEAD